MRGQVHGFLQQLGDEQVQVAHHQRLVAGLRPSGEEDVVQGLFHPVRVLAVVHGHVVPERHLQHQLVGAGAVEAHPIVFPRVLFVGGIHDQLAGLGQKNVARMQMVHHVVHLVDALAAGHIVDEIMVAHTGAPGVLRLAALQTAVEHGQLHIVGVMLFEGLFIGVRHSFKPLCLGALGPALYFCVYYIKSINKSPSTKIHFLHKNGFTSSFSLL